jgi:glycosyltransferase involved in cell wall biosynthesis
MKIAIAVHGRFHAFDLARELLRRGHDVTLLTNYPKFVTQRFGVPKSNVKSFWPHWGTSRIAAYLLRKGLISYPDSWLNRVFGHWVALNVKKEDWDVVVCWSGVGEETFHTLNSSNTLLVCQRGSAHIRTQSHLLEDEELRTGTKLDRPTPWIISREEREYNLADVILVPSSFVRNSFLEQGLSEEKIEYVKLGVKNTDFRPGQDTIEARCKRILSGAPLRVLNVGTFSFQKGMWDIKTIIGSLRSDRFNFRFIGPIARECNELFSSIKHVVTFVPQTPQFELPKHYAWGDLFVLPTIQDGFQMVLAQAAAAGLPILTTTNGAGHDLVHEGITGWVLPIRDPHSFINKLFWCDTHREELAAMVRNIYQEFVQRDWADVVTDFETICLKRLRQSESKWVSKTR